MSSSLRVAIIGSGPSGFYAAEELLKKDPQCSVDIFEHLPVPFGLVRYGVAPDHGKIKNVTRIYEKTLANERCQFYGNVTVGKDISVADLKQYYDALLFAHGCQSDRHLGIPGEDLKGSFSSTEFVAWYNGHPDYQDRSFDLSGDVAVVIGHGNVALDVARILAKTPDELKHTDISTKALEQLAESRLREIHLVGRRGPVQATFTDKELREMGVLETFDCALKASDIELSAVDQEELAIESKLAERRNFEVMKELAALENFGKKGTVHVHFYLSPVEILGENSVQAVRFERNRLEGSAGKQRSYGTGEFWQLDSSMIVRSIGYRGLPLEGLPFRDDWAIVPNEQGRVLKNDQVLPGYYVSGWIKRGPSGVIGTNKPDSIETVNHLLSDRDQLPKASTPSTESLLETLRSQGLRVIDKQDWAKIHELELERGKEQGKDLDKFTSLEQILDQIDS